PTPLRGSRFMPDWGHQRRLGGVKRLITLGGLIAALAVALAAAASTAPPTSVALVVNNQFGEPQTIVASSIPACPTGTVTDTSGPQAAFNGPIILFSGTKRFDCGAAGTFTLAYSVHTQTCSPTNSGTRMAVDDTGMYAGMSGQGLVSGMYFGGQCYPNHAGVIDNYTGTLRLATG